MMLNFEILNLRYSGISPSEFLQKYRTFAMFFIWT